MYKALQPLTGEEIIILHPRWSKRIEQLRELDHADLLVCQGCRQPLRVKAGAMRRPHFAHKHLKACSYGSESPELLNARALLYEWLHRQFGDQVTVEKQVDGANLPRPVDCWVDAPRGPFAYWIVEAGIKLDPRINIKSYMASLEGKGHFVFLSSMMNEEKKELYSLLLTPTERAFLEKTPYDELSAGLSAAGGSLHYLDFEQAVVTTFRNLVLYHRPNWYTGRKKSASLGEVRANARDGNIIYPGEQERLNAKAKKRARLAEKRRQYEERHQEQPPLHNPLPRKLRGRGVSPTDAAKPDAEAPETLPCVTCGRMTQDYWSTFYDEAGRKMCRCRECLDSGKFSS